MPSAWWLVTALINGRLTRGRGCVQNQFDSIDLSGNNIIRIEGFPKLHRLKMLICCNNRVSSIAPGLERARSTARLCMMHSTNANALLCGVNMHAATLHRATAHSTHHAHVWHIAVLQLQFGTSLPLLRTSSQDILIACSHCHALAEHVPELDTLILSNNRIEKPSVRKPACAALNHMISWRLPGAHGVSAA